jgi:hypothetical protein
MTTEQITVNSDLNPNNVYALVVGIEKYRSDQIPNLNGPARDALKYLNWLIKQKVPAQNIELFLSPLVKNEDKIEDELAELDNKLDLTRAARINVVNGINRLREEAQPNSLLHVFWSGHGFITKTNDTRRRLFYTDTTPENLYNLDIESLEEALKTSDRGNIFTQQYLFFDACAEMISRGFYHTLRAEATADKFITYGVNTVAQQYALFAAADYQAAINDAEIGTGRFAQAVLAATKNKNLRLDMQEVAKQVKSSASKTNSYRPIFLVYETGSEDRKVIDNLDRVQDTTSGIERFPRVGLHQLENMSLNDPDLEGIIGDPGANKMVARRARTELLYEASQTAHLVIALFEEGTNKEEMRICPKLCYRQAENSKIQSLHLAKKDDLTGIPLKQFPVLINQLIEYTSHQLEKLFSESVEPWMLAVELYVPSVFLSQPLSTWFGQTDWWERYPVVVGCSERFDPLVQGGAELRNQLQRGWQRFQAKVPDTVGSTLQNLAWLTSDQAEHQSFAQYSGFKCFGTWLQNNEKCQNNWIELIRSGIPLALWMCDGTPSRMERDNIFNHLTKGTRFDFLDLLPEIRTQQRKNSDHCVGVFYEDPNYWPDVPPSPDVQFFKFECS